MRTRALSYQAALRASGGQPGLHGMLVPQGPAAERLTRCISALKVLVVLLVPLVACRLALLDFWGALNEISVPAVGVFLLKGEDPRFSACYRNLSRIWLFNEFCGIQGAMSFAQALTIFGFVAGVNALNDISYLLTEDVKIKSSFGLVLISNCVVDMACAWLAWHIWRILHGMVFPALGPATDVPRARQVRSAILSGATQAQPDARDVRRTRTRTTSESRELPGVRSERRAHRRLTAPERQGVSAVRMAFRQDGAGSPANDEQEPRSLSTLGGARASSLPPGAEQAGAGRTRTLSPEPDPTQAIWLASPARRQKRTWVL